MKILKLLALLAWNYLYNTRSNSLHMMLVIAFVSIALSSAILLLGISVMNGFEQATYTQLRGIHADLIIQAPTGTFLSFDHIASIFDKEFPLLQYKPSSTQYGILTKEDIGSFVLVTVVDPRYEEKEIYTSLQPNTLVLGSKLANQLEVTKGETVQLSFPWTHSYFEPTHSDSIVAGTCTTGLEEYDANSIYCSFEYFNNYDQESGVTQVQVYIPGINLLEQTKAQLVKRFGLPVHTWQDLYPSLVATLTLEKYAVTFILCLIVILALCNIIGVLTIFLNQKKRDLALLKTMGLSARALTLFCFLFGLSIPIAASLTGLAFGGLIGLFLANYPLFTLPASYIVRYLPMQLNFSLFIAIFFFVVLMSCIIIWRASRTIAALAPAQVLRFE